VRSKGIDVLCGLAALSFIVGPIAAQDEPTTPQGVAVGPATVSPHWSKYTYPEVIPEAAPYLIIRENDTLWDLAAQYLGSPYLWPQIWDENGYITDAHWIYPGDPLLLPRVSIVAEHAGQLPPEGMPEEEFEEGMMPFEDRPGAPGRRASRLFPVTEEATLFCAGYVVQEREDESFEIVGSEQGTDQQTFADRNIVYLNKGSNSGVKAGDVYSIHNVHGKLKHPATGRTLGTKIDTKGSLRVLLAQPDAATAIIEQACTDISAGSYLRVFEPVSVPLVLPSDLPHRLTPPSGKVQGYVAALHEDLVAAGTGHLVTIDLGSEAGIAPGNLFVVYRTVFPDLPSSRQVLGELAVVAVRESTATGKIMVSSQEIVAGDRIELR